jgi:hypothetical protein
MKLALLGADAETLDFVRRAVGPNKHELVSAFDVGPYAAEVRQIAPGVQLREDWEALLLGSLADAVVVARGGAGLADATGIADEERRADQLRKLAQEAVPLLVTCPAGEAIVGFEIEMIRRDVGGAIVPLIPDVDHPAIGELGSLVALDGNSPIGAIEQVWLERQQADRSRSAVLVQLARDVALLRRLVGPIVSVSATGAPTAVGRDPLGPKPKEPPSLANLNVNFGSEAGLAARWSVGPALDVPHGKLTVIGQQGRIVLQMPAGGDWSLEVEAPQLRRTTYPSYPRYEIVLSRLARSSDAEMRDDTAWLSACRDQEAAEAVDRSLARGRTIELFNEQHTEEESFKGIMAMGGCLLLVMALAVVLLATIVEGLQLPLRNWQVWRFWPVYLLVPIGVFLLLQLLQLAVKREGGELQRLVRGKDATE